MNVRAAPADGSRFERPSRGRRRLWPAVLALIGLAVAGWVYRTTVSNQGFGAEVARNIPAPPEPPPLCPWRNPKADIAAFFPGAAAGRTELMVLSGQREELGKLLGRTPSAEDHALYIYPIKKGSVLVGTVVARRVKGSSGAIEVVVGVDRAGHVVGVHIQRIREPDLTTELLNSAKWLHQFDGKTADSDWTAPGPALHHSEESARAVWDGVRTVVIALDLAKRRGLSIPL